VLRLDARVYRLDGLLSACECDEIVGAARQKGFQPARLWHCGRLNEETFLTERRFADLIRGRLPSELVGAACADVIEVYRYHPGCHLALHQDNPRCLPSGHTSNTTLVVFLSAGFEGGYIRFPALGIEAKPDLGGAVLFSQSAAHEATAVTSGIKLVARLDLAIPQWVATAGSHH
jgi:hypothetical protein